MPTLFVLTVVEKSCDLSDQDLKWGTGLFDLQSESRGKHTQFSLKLKRVKTGNKNVQLVFQHCCKTSWTAMLPVLPSTNQTCLATNQVAAGCRKTGFNALWSFLQKKGDVKWEMLLINRSKLLFNTFCSRFARFTVASKSKGGSISTRFLGGRAVGKACAFTGKLLVTETFRACS